MRARSEPASPESASVLGGAGAALVSFVVGEARTWVFAIAKNAEDNLWKVEKAAALAVRRDGGAQEDGNGRRQVGLFRVRIGAGPDGLGTVQAGHAGPDRAAGQVEL